MRKIIEDKKGNILTENIIFIILNLVFISILLLFVFSKTGNAAVLEEKYAKQIVLMIDSAEPLTVISLDMSDASKIAEKQDINPGGIVSIDENIVSVRLREGGGYRYSFFNDVDVSVNFDREEGRHVFFISENE